MLTAEGLYNAEGGNAGLAIQTGVVLTGLTGLAVANPALSNAYRAGALGRMQFGSIVACALASHWLGQQISIGTVGNRTAYNNHWVAYGFVKS